MRSLTAGILGQLTVSGALYGWLIQIVAGTTTLRFTSIDGGFGWNSQIWAEIDMELPQLSWDGSVLKPGKLVLGDADLSIWTLALLGQITDAAVSMWAIYNAAPTEAEPVWQGYAGQCVRDGTKLTVEITLSNLSDVLTAPRYRVQQFVSPTFMIPAGTVLNVSGQPWVIDRPGSSAG